MGVIARPEVPTGAWAEGPPSSAWKGFLEKETQMGRRKQGGYFNKRHQCLQKAKTHAHQRRQCHS